MFSKNVAGAKYNTFTSAPDNRRPSVEVIAARRSCILDLLASVSNKWVCVCASPHHFNRSSGKVNQTPWKARNPHPHLSHPLTPYQLQVCSLETRHRYRVERAFKRLQFRFLIYLEYCSRAAKKYVCRFHCNPSSVQLVTLLFYSIGQRM